MRTTSIIFSLTLLAAAVASFKRVPELTPVGFHVKPAIKTTADGAVISWHTSDARLSRIDYWINPKQVYNVTEAEPVDDHVINLAGLEAGTNYSYRIVSGGRLSPVYKFQTGPRKVALHVEPSAVAFLRLPAFTVQQFIAFHVEPYLQLPAPNAMTIQWETTSPLTSQVEYGLTEDLGSVQSDKREVRLHQVRLTGLEPATRYCYRVRSAELVSPIQSFRTAPPPGTGKWRLAVYGDSRSNPAMHRKVVEQIALHDVDLILHTGDIVLDGRNYDLWRREFFAPIAPIAGRIPWISTIGNHERDSANYFSYAALPGNQHYYGFDYANAHIIGLDSNGGPDTGAWLSREGHDRQQLAWLEEHLKKPRSATWTFVAFHHPLFSAHRNRAINPLRWIWAPVFLDPENKVDGVLTGHDHFYARNFPMARLGDGPQRGVLFLTTAGGGASLYPIKQRDYVAYTEAVHHFTLFEFDGDQVSVSAIDITGRVLDHWTLAKEPTPSENLCAYEVEVLREFLRKSLALAKPLEVSGNKPTSIDTVLEVPSRFAVPVEGMLRWEEPFGWQMKEKETPFDLRPGEPLRIPLQATVDPKGLGASPKLTIEFLPGRFRNRKIEVSPFKLTSAGRVSVAKIGGVRVDGQITEPSWQRAPALELLPPPGLAVPALDQVRLASDGRQLYVAARLMDAARKVRVPPPSSKDASRLALSGEHVRVELSDGQHTHLFALSADQVPYHALDGKENSLSWSGAAAAGDGCWTAELAIPLNVFANRSNLRINVIHRGEQNKEFELRPTFGLGDNPDVIPPWKSVNAVGQYAELRWE
jgi:hypothetical protein